jgi:hypothetical protein
VAKTDEGEGGGGGARAFRGELRVTMSSESVAFTIHPPHDSQPVLTLVDTV